MPDSSKFGRYEVEEEVARGGMGVVYRVRDPQMRRFLAMKVLLSEEEGRQAESGSRHSNLSARFTDEAQLTGQLDHPGIIPVYDMGQDDDGRLFVAANHWPRAWYHRALENPDVSVTRNGETTDYRAVPVSEEERERLLDESGFPLVAYFFTGFAPRQFLRLDPR
jgi:serine/threonine protein kinase